MFGGTRKLEAAVQAALDLGRQALEAANAVKARVDGHENVCTERWRESRDTSKELKESVEKVGKSVGGIWKLILTIGGAVIVGLLALIMTLVFGWRH